KIASKGWPELFADPQAGIRAFEGTGFRPAPYAANGTGFASTGIPVTLSNTEAKQPNRMTFSAAGTQDTLDSVTVALDLTDAPNATVAKDRFVKTMGEVLGKIGVPGAAELKQPVLDEKPAAGSVDGADYAVAIAPMTDAGADARRITVTFRRPGAPKTDDQASNQATIQPRNG
ncbi:MAG: hypothetical protein SFV21_06960, partial [Rhodospirillaceae bacterium]|nr:hypothetical protein [Rhodospirillaceae bacterium]